MIDYQFIPIRCLSEPLPFVRRHHPRCWNYVTYQPPYTNVPPLRCHVHPYLAIYNAIYKLDKYPTEKIPSIFDESIDLARKIWNVWMDEKVPGPPLNAGHPRKATKRHQLNSGQPVSSHLRGDSSSQSSVSVASSIGSNRQRYCDEQHLYPFYTKPRRDPPVPVKDMLLPRRKLDTEPETVWTHPSSTSSRIGLPPLDKPQYWPDEEITPSCVESTASGVWYERDGKREFITFGRMPVGFKGSAKSYLPFDDPVYQKSGTSFHRREFGSDTPLGRSIMRVFAVRDDQRYPVDDGVSDIERPPPTDPSAFYSKDVPLEPPSMESWRQSLRPTKPPVGRKKDRILAKYQAEPSMPKPDSDPWTWRPDSLPLWSKRALKRRAEAVVVVSSEYPTPPFWIRKRKRAEPS